MRIRLFSAIAVFALLLGSGSATAGDSLATLGDVSSTAMTQTELDAVVAAASFKLSVPNSAPGTYVVPIDDYKSITGRADGRSGTKGLDLAEHKANSGLDWID